MTGTSGVRRRDTGGRAAWLAAPLLGLVLLGGIGAAAAADFQTGWQAYQQGDFAVALREWQPLADGGDPRALYNVGVLYDQGKVAGGPPVRPLDRFYTRVQGDTVEVGPRYSVNSELKRFDDYRDPAQDLDGIGQYLYPPRFSTPKQ